MSKIIILSSSPMPAYGIYTKSPISVDEARELVQEYGWISFIGHSATATALSSLLGITLPLNRAMWAPQDGDICLAMTPKKRLEEGQILTDVDEILSLFDISQVTYRQ